MCGKLATVVFVLILRSSHVWTGCTVACVFIYKCLPAVQKSTNFPKLQEPLQILGARRSTHISGGASELHRFIAFSARGRGKPQLKILGSIERKLGAWATRHPRFVHPVIILSSCTFQNDIFMSWRDESLEKIRYEGTSVLCRLIVWLLEARGLDHRV